MPPALWVLCRGMICFDFLLLAIYLVLLSKTSHMGESESGPSGLVHVTGGGLQVEFDSQRSIYQYILAACMRPPTASASLHPPTLVRLLVNAGLAAYARWLSKCRISSVLKGSRSSLQ